MKKVAFLILFIAVFLYMGAQKITLNLYGAYVFDNRFDYYYNNYDYYDGKIKASFQMGAGIEYRFNPIFSAELSYLRQKTHSPVYYQQGSTEPEGFKNFDLAMDFILIGGQSYVTADKGKIEGYGGIEAGVVLLHLSDASTGMNNDTTKLTWGGKVGVNFWFTKDLGLKVQGQLLLVSHATGGEFYFGDGNSGIAIGNYATIYQVGVGGGVLFRIGKNKSQPVHPVFY